MEPEEFLIAVWLILFSNLKFLLSPFGAMETAGEMREKWSNERVQSPTEVVHQATHAVQNAYGEWTLFRVACRPQDLWLSGGTPTARKVTCKRCLWLQQRRKR